MSNHEGEGAGSCGPLYSLTARALPFYEHFLSRWLDPLTDMQVVVRSIAGPWATGGLLSSGALMFASPDRYRRCSNAHLGLR